MTENEIASGISARATTRPARSSMRSRARAGTRGRAGRARRMGHRQPYIHVRVALPGVTHGTRRSVVGWAAPMAPSAPDPTTAPPLLQIGEVAERVGLSLRTVRYYEEQGLLTPESRTAGGFRLFSEEQVDRLLLIKQMKPLGFSVQEMCDLLDARDVARGAHTGDRAAA